VIRLTKLTEYAVVVMTQMATSGPVHTAAALADRTGLPAPTVAKLLKLAARGGLIVSQRGAAGGYSLARPPADISVAAIVQAIDGPIALTECVDGSDSICGVETLCPIRGGWDRLNRAVRRALEDVSLADMVPAPLPSLAVHDDARGAGALRPAATTDQRRIG
jgi:FeS assembly SUF system regulator